jgi:hypothetical protein
VAACNHARLSAFTAVLPAALYLCKHSSTELWQVSAHNNGNGPDKCTVYSCIGKFRSCMIPGLYQDILNNLMRR